MSKLKPCPFCGCNPSRDTKRTADYTPEVWQAVIYCSNCRANIEITYSASQYIKNPEKEAKRNVARMWNRRYIDGEKERT